MEKWGQVSLDEKENPPVKYFCPAPIARISRSFPVFRLAGDKPFTCSVRYSGCPPFPPSLCNVSWTIYVNVLPCRAFHKTTSTACNIMFMHILAPVDTTCVCGTPISSLKHIILVAAFMVLTARYDDTSRFPLLLGSGYWEAAPTASPEGLVGPA